jgi:hypothetical protein
MTNFARNTGASNAEKQTSEIPKATSAMGQTRHFERAPITSGLPLRTDINAPTRLVRFVP